MYTDILYEQFDILPRNLHFGTVSWYTSHKVYHFYRCSSTSPLSGALVSVLNVPCVLNTWFPGGGAIWGHFGNWEVGPSWRKWHTFEGLPGPFLSLCVLPSSSSLCHTLLSPVCSAQMYGAKRQRCNPQSSEAKLSLSSSKWLSRAFWSPLPH